MTAHIANGGYKIYPHIVVNDNKKHPSDKYMSLYENSKNINMTADIVNNSVIRLSFLRPKISCLGFIF